MRKYEIDLWGDLASYKKINKFFNKMFWLFCFKHRFKYRILRVYFRRRRVKNFKYSTILPKKIFRKFYRRYYIKRLHILMRLRTYYGGFNLKKFRKYLKSSLKRNIDFTSSLLLLLECRLDILFLKLNLVKSLQEVKFFIKSGSIYINNKLITNYKEQLYLNDVITIKNKEKYYDFILERLYKRRILFNYPRYIEANYEIMKFILIFYPKIRDLSSPLKNDLHILRKIF